MGASPPNPYRGSGPLDPVGGLLSPRPSLPNPQPSTAGDATALDQHHMVEVTDGGEGECFMMPSVDVGKCPTVEYIFDVCT